jgi:predicted TIM-barrel fold metal-dependent hydrolase
MFSTAEALGTVLCSHIGSSSKIVVTAPDAPMDVLITLSPINIVQAAADIVWSPAMKKFPNLRFALSEGGIGWVPYFRERITGTYEKHRFWTGQDLGTRTPNQVFDEQVVLCFIEDTTGLKNLDDMNEDMVCWECDYPHADSTWPMSPESFLKEVEAAGLTDAQIDKVSHQNAMRAFQFDPFSVRPREECTVSALRKNAEGWDVSIQARGIKASATGAADLGKFSSAQDG